MQRIWQEQGKALGAARQVWAAERRQQNDEHARGLGYEDFLDLLDKTRDMTHPQFAVLLGWPKAAATWWRLEYGYCSTAYAAAAARRLAQQRAGLDQVPAGQQPATGDELRCLECGRWYADLAQHLRAKHRIEAVDYRRAHELRADLPLSSEAARRRLRDHLAAQSRTGGHAAGRAMHERALRGYDEVARAHHYPGIAALLRAHTDAEVTRMLGLKRGQAWKIRRRYAAGVLAEAPPSGPTERPQRSRRDSR